MNVSRRAIVLFVCFGLLFVLNLFSVLQAEQFPWLWILGGFVVGFLGMGPLPWLARSQYLRGDERFIWIAVAVLFAAVTAVLLVSVGLLRGWFGVESDGVFLGIAGGLTAALFVEATIVPSKYRGVVDSE